MFVYDKEKMDASAGEAQRELYAMPIPDEALSTIKAWLNRWYLKAGWKRLAKILADKESYTAEL